MSEWLGEIPGWYTGFLLLVVWVCGGLVLYWIQQKRKKSAEQEKERERNGWRSEGHETVEDLERKFGGKKK